MHLNSNSNNTCGWMKSTKTPVLYYAVSPLTKRQCYWLIWWHTRRSTCQVTMFVINCFLRRLISSSTSLHTPIGKQLFLCNKRNSLSQDQRLLEPQKKQKVTKHITLFLAARRGLGRLWPNSSQHTQVTRPLTLDWRGNPWLKEHTQAGRFILVAYVGNLLL